MSTTERLPRRRPGASTPTAGLDPKLTGHPVLWCLHAGLAHVFLPAIVGPAFVAALTGISLAGRDPISGTALVLLLVGLAVGGALGALVGPRTRLFAPRGPGTSRRSRRLAR